MHLAYANATLWSMDNTIPDTTGNNISVSFVTGVANKAIVVYKSENIFSISFASNFSISMWVKINGSGMVFKANRLSVRYNNNSALKIHITPSNGICAYLLHYKNWPMNVYLHIVFRSQTVHPYLQLYKNSVVQKPDIIRKCDCNASSENSVQLFHGSAYDDVAIWTTQLSTSKIEEIFNRYSKASILKPV